MRRRGMLGLLVLAALARPGVADAEVSIQAQLSRSQITVGEAATLEVNVDGGFATVGEPTFDVPGGLELLGSSRSQNMSWVNGKSTNQTTFRFEIAGVQPGTYAVGPIRVRVGGQWYESGTVRVSVASQRQSVGAKRGRGPAELLVDVTPRDPYVGQPVVLRVRLVQRATLAEDPSYTPPPAPGFWAERSTQPESFYADEGSARVLVTETRTRLYPLAAGVATVGEGSATLTIALSLEPSDPFPWLSRPAARREVVLRSDPVNVRVHPLPAGAPEGFDGGVGQWSTAWRGDRHTTPQDVPITVWLEVRGIGNLPLLRTPNLQVPGADVFSSTVQDSFGGSGGSGSGRRRFQWTVLPRRIGTLTIEPPPLAWFDYQAGEYRRLDAPALEVKVEPPTRSGTSDASGFPVVFTEHPVDPFARPARPWGFAIAGVLAGIGIRVLLAERARRRRAAAPPPTWVQGLRHTRGASFLAAADRAVTALAERGVDVADLRRRVDGARYGGVPLNETIMRKGLLERIEKSGGAPAPGPGLAPWLAGVALLGTVVVLFFSLPRGGEVRMAQRARSADAQARSGDVERAWQEWFGLWRAGSRSAGLAARLAWATVSSGRIAEASAWAARGAQGEPRDPALEWTIHQIRDAGGLDGFSPPHIPVRTLEWSLLALALGVASGWMRRRLAIILVACAAVVAIVPPGEQLLASRAVRAVTREPLALEGEGLELAAGHLVVVRQRTGGRARVLAGSHIEGWVPAAGLIPVSGTP